MIISRYNETDKSSEWERFQAQGRQQMFFGFRKTIDYAMDVPKGYFSTNNFFVQLIRTHNN